METWTKEHLVFTTKQYLKHGSVARAQKSFRFVFGQTNSPSKKVIYRCARNFNSKGSIDKKKPGRAHKTKRTVANIDAVQQRVSATPEISIRRLAQETETSSATVHRILRKDLHLYPYKAQTVQEISITDKEKRLRFARWFRNKTLNDPLFLDKLITSDEAHFHLKIKPNKQNSRIWALENPQAIAEMPLHSTRVTIWCAVTSREIIGPYFFEDEHNNTVTVNAERYEQMLVNFLFPKVNELANVFWFQQDGAPCHTARLPMSLLKNQFPQKIISKFGDVEWPARSPDLSPLDFYLWGYLKNKVYRNKPTTLHDLKQNIIQEIGAITPQTLAKTMQNMVKRVDECIRLDGDHLKRIIFKKD